MQFERFHWLNHHGIPCSTNMIGKRVILVRFYYLFSLFFYILGAFLIKQLFHSRLLDMRLVIANSALRATLAIYHLISMEQLLNSPQFSKLRALRKRFEG